jgi:2'-5' RNA ligase
MVDSGHVRARLFVALWPPQDVIDSLTGALRVARSHGDELHWQPPDRWHITVGFLGDRDEDDEVARFPTLARPVPAPVRLAGSGHFGRVLWVGVESARWLAELAQNAAHTLHAERRRFRGHITLARARTRDGDRQLTQVMSDLADFQSPEWTPLEVTLVRSALGPRPRYDVIARSPLTGVGP